MATRLGTARSADGLGLFLGGGGVVLSVRGAAQPDSGDANADVLTGWHLSQHPWWVRMSFSFSLFRTERRQSPLKPHRRGTSDA